jgi:hypothetical protein
MLELNLQISGGAGITFDLCAILPHQVISGARIETNPYPTRRFSPSPGRAAPQRQKNSGNKVKKLLKTKHPAFLSAANWSGFCLPAGLNPTPERPETTLFKQNEPEAPTPTPRRRE